MIIPVAISGIAFRAGIPKAHDAREPVQAPVIGNGIATRTTRNIGPYLAKWLVWALRIDLARQSNNDVRKVGYLRSRVAPMCRHGTSNNTGMMFPKIDTGKTWYQGKSRTCIPMGIEIRSSPTGVMAAKKTCRSAMMSIESQYSES